MAHFGRAVLCGVTALWLTTSLPQMYFVPRTGALRRVLIHDTGRLRVLRTELELLKRVHRHARRTGRWGLAVADATRCFNEEDAAELADILRNARRPIVREMIAVIDDEFPELRKEIMMSVVNEEAERIVDEAQAAGVVGEAPVEPETTSATETALPTPSLEDIDATLAAAQSQLASVVEDVGSPTTGATSTDEPPVDATPAGAAPTDTTQVETTPTEVAATESCAVDGSADAEASSADDTESPASAAIAETVEAATDSPVDENPEVSPSTTDAAPKPDADTSETVTDAADSVAQASAQVVTGGDDSEPGFQVQDVSMDEPVYPDSASSDAPSSSATHDAASTGTANPLSADHSPERVERTVAEIEQGIRKLAALLSGEVNDQWHRAREAFVEVENSRTTMAEAGREAAPIVAEMKRLAEEAKQTQQTLEVAAQEAKAFREETRRAKERAETSAAAAELAAEQVVREVENARAASRG